jgi:hypothetical protein
MSTIKRCRTALAVVGALFLFQATAVFAEITQEEHDALMALYTSTGGYNWTNTLANNQPWDDIPGNEGGWFGVTVTNVDGSDHVTSLLLPGNNLVGTLPSELGNLDSSAFNLLDLSSNQLTATIPNELQNLNGLLELNLSHNQLGSDDTGIPSGLWSLPSLTMLDLSDNQLTLGIPPGAHFCGSLQTLNLGNNLLTGPIPPDLGTPGGLISLTTLNLSNNKLHWTIPANLGNVTTLNYLYLNGNMLTGEIPVELASLTALVTDTGYNDGGLDLRWNALHSSDPSLIDFLNNKQTGGDWQSTQTVAPTDVAAGTPTSDTIPLSWTPITYTGDAGGYQVSYGTTQGGPYLLFGTTADKLASSLEVSGLTAATPYYFVVETVTEPHPTPTPYENQNTVVSEPSAEVSGTTLCAAPGAPSLVSATGTCAGVELTWAAGTTGTTSVYQVYRAASCGGESTLICGPIAATSCSDTDLVEGVPHTYWVRGACDMAGLSLSSDSNCLTAARGVTQVPTITGGPSNTCPSATATLSTEAGMSAYQWYLGGGTTGTDASTLIASASGNYSVAYTGANGCRGVSAGYPVTINVCPPETAPGDSPGTAQTWSGKETMNWPANPLALTYNLYRGIKGDLLNLLLTGTPNACTRYQGTAASATGLLDDASLVTGGFYWYLVTASNAAGEGPAGNATAGPRTVNSTGACSP